mmetsp:Transcript_17258/g.35620  ORF Transcript_17258/g.35620 Transcript_17258/m.35620 type:complete len:281 (-) Transcript_17258:216-1058(-)
MSAQMRMLHNFSKLLVLQSAKERTRTMGGNILRAGSTSATTNNDAIGIKQLFDDVSCTYTYLLWDKSTKDAILVDPVDTHVDRDLEEVKALDLKLVYAINTHAHADHITGTGLLKKALPGLESVISESSGAKSDRSVSHGDKIVFGGQHLEVKATPGHTEGCVSLVSGDKSFVLTGDTLLVQGCGRTDFQGGSPETLWNSVKSQLFSLPDTTVVYPAHDYKGRTHSTVGAEKEKNPRLGGDKSKEQFVDIMNNLNLSYPKKIDVAVPANMRCGVQDDDGV